VGVTEANVITTKRELAEYLREHDPEMLEFFVEAAKEFGPAETVAYIRAEGPKNDRS
jgi:hypothetical protein